MNLSTRLLRYLPALFFLIFSSTISAQSSGRILPQEFYQIKIYHFTNAEQEVELDDYLKTAYLPALHKASIKNIGVFKPLTNDTAADKRIYVFFAAASAEKLIGLTAQLLKDKVYSEGAKKYMAAAFDHPHFTRFETILLKAFLMAPQMKTPNLKGEKKERIYELRSYESATEKLYNSKIKMFNEGGEIALFKRLDFNAIFYADVISGSRMPNLMYMTSFENKTERDEHWKTFGADPEWKTLSALPEYQHTVSKADVILMHATDYSDL